MDVKVRVKKLHEKAKLPLYQTAGAAGFDLYACLREAVTLAPMERALIPTGIAIQIADKSLCALCYARSGLAIRSGIALANGVGVIDSDYTGEIQVGVINFSNAPYTIYPQDRIAQVVLTPVVHAVFEEVETLEETGRGGGGFGSTGR